jgi:hypothetical protein
VDKGTICRSLWLFLFAAILAADSAILAAHVSRFVNEDVIPAHGFTWAIFVQYWNASMWGIAVEVFAFFMFLALLIFISAKDKLADRKVMEEMPKKTAKAIREEFQDVFKVIIDKDTTTIAMTMTIKKESSDGNERKSPETKEKA